MTTLTQIRNQLVLKEVKTNHQAKKLREILESTAETMSAEEHDQAVDCNGITGLTRDDVAKLIGLAHNDQELCYRLAKILVDLNQD